MVLAEVRDPESRARVDDRPSTPRVDGVHGGRPRPSTREGLTRSALFAVGMGLALAGLHVLLADVGWWLSGMVMILLAVVPAALLRAGGRPLLASPAGLVAVLLGLTLGFAPGSAILGIVPTADTVEAFGRLAVGGLDAIRNQGVPAIATPGLAFLIAVLAGLVAVLGDLATSRTPALAAAPLLVVIAVPAYIRPEVTDPVIVVLVAVVYLALLRTGRRPAPRASTMATAATVLVGSLVVPALLPEPGADRSPAGDLGPGTGVDPLVDLGEDLRRGDPVIALRYASNAGRGIYLRLATLDEFDGDTWRPGRIRTDESTSIDSDPPVPPGLDEDVPTSAYSVAVELVELSGVWLPLPYPATAIGGLSGDWYWDTEGMSVRGRNSGLAGQGYDAEFLVVRPSSAQLIRSRPDPGGEGTGLDLPDDVPEAVLEAARTVTAGTTSSYQAAIALQRFFTDGAFTYSEEAPVDSGYDGGGVDVLDEFLDRKAGYCVHFASAMAVMARALGIPSRVVVGFQPGSPEIVDGVTVYTVTTHDLHAWPELFFEGIGWLRFEPTPGRGTVPDYSAPAAVDDPATPGDEGGVPLPAPTSVPTAAPGATAPPIGLDPGAVGASGASVSLVLPGILLGALALSSVPALVRGAIRGARMRRVRVGPRGAAAAWDEVRDTARDHGWLAPDTETPRTFAARLGVLPQIARPAVLRLREAVEAEAFGRNPAPLPDVADVRTVLTGIARTSPRGTRARAVLLPPTLLSRLGRIVDRAARAPSAGPGAAAGGVS